MASLNNSSQNGLNSFASSVLCLSFCWGHFRRPLPRGDGLDVKVIGPQFDMLKHHLKFMLLQFGVYIYIYLLSLKKQEPINKQHLVGGFNQSSQIGVKSKKYLKPPTKHAFDLDKARTILNLIKGSFETSRDCRSHHSANSSLKRSISATGMAMQTITSLPIVHLE